MSVIFNLLFFVAVLFLSGSSFCQTFEWVKAIGYNNSAFSNDQSKGQSVSTDLDGNVYIAGYNSSDGFFLTKLDPTGTNIIWHNTFTITNLTFENVNLEIDFNNDIIIQQDNTIRKYDQNGNLLWQVVNCSGSGQASSFDFTIDPTGNIYIVGTFNGVIDFNPGTATNNQTAQGNSQQIFIQKLNSSGNFVSVYRTFDELYSGFTDQWKAFSAKLFDIKYQSGKVYILGNTTGSLGMKFTNSTTIFGPFLLGLNSNCTFNFANKITVNCPEFIDAKLNLSYNGIVNVVAKLDGTQVVPFDFDPGTSEALIAINGTNGRIVKASYSSLGEFIGVKIIIDNWAVRINNFSIGVDSNQNFYFAGTFAGTVDFDPSNNTNSLTAKYFLQGGIPTVGKDIFFANYDIGGDFLNCNQVGNYQSESANDIYIKSNYCLITGQFDFHYSPTSFSTSFPVDFDFDNVNSFNVMSPPRAYALKLSLCSDNSLVDAGNDQTTCQGQSVILNGSGANTYSWNNGVINNTAFTPTATNTYVVVGTDANGCQDSDSVNITVNQNTSSTITQTANNSYTLNGQTYTQSGTYTQVIPNTNGCDSTITLNLTINNIGIDEVSNLAISIYPNPASNQITIAYTGQIQKVEIMDAKGAKVYSSIENKKEIVLSSSMQTGYYTVLVHTQEGIFRKELVVNR